jgi:glycosidase
LQQVALKDKKLNKFNHIQWSVQGNIYEVNVRQFSPEGSFTAFEKHLPRLQQMGADILWFMPIQPIGVKNRKGGLGSYYSCRDYTAINPEFGTLNDFKRVVDRAHALGMHVIIDWVANHTAWDHAWVSEHPEWYKKDARGDIHAYTYRATPDSEPEYWTDVVGLDFTNPALWPAMTEAMLYWMRETNIDGFRCDVASLVPTLFWEQVRKALEQIRPVFMLAESDAPDLHAHAFDMTYDWRLYDALKLIVSGKANTQSLRDWWTYELTTYPSDAFRMRYTANHDTNSWHGHDVEFYGDAFKAMAVLAATLPGMPLIYGGQEAVLDHKLAFFEKDTIHWKNLPLQDFYRGLLQLKRAHPALANGAAGNTLEWLPSDAGVAAFVRGKDVMRIRVLVNLTDKINQFNDVELPAWGWSIDLYE